MSRGVLLTIVGLLLAAVPVAAAEWQTVYDCDDEPSRAVAVAADDSGNVFVLADLLDESQGSPVGITVAKLDAGGVKRAEWVYDSTDAEGVEIVVDGQNDDIYVLTRVDEFEYWVLQFDAASDSGELNWADCAMDEGADEFPADMALQRQGSVVLGVGVSVTAFDYVDSLEEPSEEDFLTIAYGPNGTRRWEAGFDWGISNEDLDRTDIPMAVGVDPADGAVYVAGKSVTGSCDVEEDDIRVSVVKYAAGGGFVWSTSFVRENYDVGAEFLRVADIAVGAGERVYTAETYLDTTAIGADDDNLQIRATGTDKVTNIHGHKHVDADDYHETPVAIATGCQDAVYILGQRVPVAESDSQATMLVHCYSAKLRQELWYRHYPLGAVPPLQQPDEYPLLSRALAVDTAGTAYVTGTETVSDPGDTTTSSGIVTLMYRGDGLGTDVWHYNNLGLADTSADIVVCPGPDGEWVCVIGTTVDEEDSLPNVVVMRYDVPEPEGVWLEVEPVPIGAGVVREGGWLEHATSAGSDYIYAVKGKKSLEFWRYDVADGSWLPRSNVEEGLEGKMPGKGCRGVWDGGDYIYMTKGHNTLGFHLYDIASDSWSQLPDVPEGPIDKKVKGGTDMVYVEKDSVGYVYLLKGYKTEFYRFNTMSDTWESLPNVPWGYKEKWDKGSWLVHDGASDGWLYAHEAKYYDRATYNHYMFRYDLAADTWDTRALDGMPLLGLHGGRVRKKKSKDGGCAAYLAGRIYALKGGNTQQFFKYDTTERMWSELDTVPTNGSTGKKKRVKKGADIVYCPGSGALYALKGNKTREFWEYGSGAGSPQEWGRASHTTRPAGGGLDGEEAVFEGFEAYRPRWNAAGTWVVYFREDDDGDLQIFASPYGGGDEVQLTDVETDCEYPVWSPDGEYVAFQIDDTLTGFYQIAKVAFEEEDTDLSAPAEMAVSQVTKRALQSASATVLRPNRHAVEAVLRTEQMTAGSSVLRVAEDAAVVVSAAEVQPVPRRSPATDEDIDILTSTEYDHEYPEWSPDGQYICFQRDDEYGYTQVFRIEAEGGDEEQLTDDEADHEMPVWLNDENVVYVHSPDEDYEQIGRFDISGMDQSILTTEETDHAAPAASPDGEDVCYQYLDEWGMYQIGRVSAEGGDEDKLTEEGIDLENPTWSSDGQSIFCTGWRYPGTEIGLVDAISGGYEAQTDSTVIRDYPDVFYDSEETEQNLVVYEREGSAEAQAGGLDRPRPPRPKREGTGVFLVRVAPSTGSGAQGAGQGRVVFGRLQPNPAPGRVLIRWQVPSLQRVSLRAYDITGRLVRVLCEGTMKPGEYNLTWDGTDDAGRKLARGVYCCKLESDDQTVQRKLVLVR
ncbi:PD40 domain-containing protein [candidate division WOR-3 bacterium]|nr:PD40 domain-containing protein [candidate division WOR-3 bacterium]